MKCRFCHSEVGLGFLDLGSAPPSNAYLTREALNGPERWFPLRLLVCETCWLVQTEDFAGPELYFSADYAYLSSTSVSWLAHAKKYTGEMMERFALNQTSLVCEIAANDGYLLRNFVEHQIPCYGIEPTASTAAVARSLGLDIIEKFFGSRLAADLVGEGRSADLIVANNVLAHVPDIGDFVSGFTTLLNSDGVATFEFPHLLNMVEHDQFDTAYHEHFSYLSLTAAQRIFEARGLQVFDVEELPTHGGSLRVYAQRADTKTRAVEPRVSALLEREADARIETSSFYAGFQARAESIKNDLLRFLIDAKRDGKVVAAYGAAAKGNTLLNFAGIRSDLVRFVVDRAHSKQGRYMPGSHIPICSEDRLRAEQPDYVLILPWNLRTELIYQLADVRKWGGRFICASPTLNVE